MSSVFASLTLLCLACLAWVICERLLDGDAEIANAGAQVAGLLFQTGTAHGDVGTFVQAVTRSASGLLRTPG